MLDANTLRHFPFFEEVAGLEEDSDAWRSATAGLVTLRLVDAWLESAEGDTADDEWNFRSVCAAVDKVNDRSSAKGLLTRILEAMRKGKASASALTAPVTAYAQSLEYDAKWRLAADVYQTLLGHLHPLEDSEASVTANIRLAVCYRTLNELENAAAAYAAASEIGSAVGDLVGVLRARIGDASLAHLRGNLPQAGRILDETIELATGPELQEVRARALNDRSGVAILSGQYELGIRLAYDAIVQTKSQIERDRILNNIAFAFMQLGVYSAARDAFLVLTATAQEQYMRWAATINLLDVASMTGSRVLFEQHHRSIVGARLDPFLEASLELSLGNGYNRFQEPVKASTHLTRAVALAGEHRLNQLLIEAEKALEAVETQKPLPRQAPVFSPEVQEVANALREMRQTVGVE